jgi:hypothetical protein
MSVSMPCSPADRGRFARATAVLGRCPGAASRLAGLFLLAVLATAPAFAHKASDAFLDLRGDAARPGSFVARWDIALRDLDLLVDLDPDGDGVVRWRDVERRGDEVTQAALAAIAFARDARPCAIAAPARAFARRNDGGYLVLRFRIDCAPDGGTGIEVRYQLMAGVDPTHRAVLSLAGAGVDLAMLRQSASFVRIETAAATAAGFGSDVRAFFGDGLRHILDGPDHLAFLLALLVVAVAGPGWHGGAGTAGNRASTGARAAGAAAAGDGLRAALPALLLTITVFTVAHSITLAFTAFGKVTASSRLVETAVAASVAVGGAQAMIAAVLGRHHRFATMPVWLVFGFGLVHGIGFGASLGESGFAGRSALSALLGFNLGVEAGQLAVLVAVLPLTAILIAMPRFRVWGLATIGLAIALAGIAWFVARVTG